MATVKQVLEQVDAIYQFVVKNLSYDYIKAQNVKSGYLPALDKVLELDSRFHTQIANAAQNPMLATITEYITRLTMPSRLETTRKVLAKGEEEIERFVELHRQLLSVIERRQVDEIAATVQDHYIFWKK